jgi:DNA repair photolyase
MENTRAATLPLFPDPSAPCHPAGIARLAGAAPEIDHGCATDFHALTVRSILNRAASHRRLPFAWTINPYRGCEFACRYCYARYTHEFMELRRPEDFDRQIFLKQNAAWLLRQELARVAPGEEIAIGTATDPYQPIERRARITQSLLEVLADQRNLRIGIVTKSTLIARDIPLLRRIAASNRLTLHLTITTPDADLARLLEPRAPRPDLRFATISRLRQAGLRAGVLCCPLLPAITDTGVAIDRMAAAAKAVDASFLYAQPLFLKPCSKETYFAFIHEHFPQLEPMYRERYADSAFLPRAYAERVRGLVEAARRKHNLGQRREPEREPDADLDPLSSDEIPPASGSYSLPFHLQ